MRTPRSRRSGQPWSGDRCLPPVAAIAVVAALVTAGCLGTAGPGAAGDVGGPEDLPAPPASFVPVGPDDPAIDAASEGNRTELTFHLDGLHYRDALVGFAIRAEEDLLVGQSSEGQVRVDEYPADGWFATTVFVMDAPVEDIYRGGAGGEHGRIDHGMWWQRTTTVSQGDVHVGVHAAGENVVDVGASQPEPIPPGISWTQGNLTDMNTLDRGNWTLLLAGGASPDMVEESKLRLAVTGPVELYRVPEANLVWGFGFAGEGEATVAGTVGHFEAVVDAEVTHETESFSTLHVRTHMSGQGEGRALFLGESVPLPEESELSLSAPAPGTIGFEVDSWTGAPFWYFADAWIPTVQPAVGS